MRRLALVAAAILASSATVSAQAVTQPALKAAFLFNFAKFVEWPADPGTASPLTLCVLDDAAVEDALGQLVSGGPVNGRMVTLAKGARPLRSCHVLYVGDSESGRAVATLNEL